MASEEEIIIIGGGGKRPKQSSVVKLQNARSALRTAQENPESVYAIARAMIDLAELEDAPIRFTKGHAVDIRKDGTEYDDEAHTGITE